MRTNLDASVPRLREQRGGSVVVMASIAGLTGSPDVFYATSKYALIGLVREIAGAVETVLAEGGSDGIWVVQAGSATERWPDPVLAPACLN